MRFRHRFGNAKTKLDFELNRSHCALLNTQLTTFDTSQLGNSSMYIEDIVFKYHIYSLVLVEAVVLKNTDSLYTLFFPPICILTMPLCSFL